MAAFALSAVAERLDYLLLADGAPSEWAGDLRDGIVQLLSEIDRINEILSDVEAMKNISGDLKKRVSQLAYDIEDAVDFYAAKGKPGVFGCGFNCSPVRRLRQDLDIFTRMIDELKPNFNFTGAPQKDATAGHGEISSSSSTSAFFGAAPHRRQHGEVIVEMEQNKHQLLTLLLGQRESNLSSIAICGMGGVGKTTLAQLLYNDRNVVEHFDSLAWAVVGTEFRVRDILETILFSIASTGSASKDEIAQMEITELMQQLYKAQMGVRYLVVLDNMWSIEDWDTLRFAFPDGKNGSKIVITTRHMSVAPQATYTYMISPLCLDASWQLFQIKSGLGYGNMLLDPEMECTGKEIVTHCAGLPVVLALIGGILWGKNKEYWHMILSRLKGTEAIDSVLRLFTLCYNLLPFHLKPCLLYLGLFPPNQAIPVEKLYLLWMAEGLISMRATNKTRNEVAEDYFNQLFDRNLVKLMEDEEEEEVSPSRRSISCLVLDVVRDLCIQKAKEEEFFKVLSKHEDERSFLTRKHTSYLYKFGAENDVVIFNTSEAKCMIRSLFFFDSLHQRSSWPREFSDLKEFQSMRVLDFDGVDFKVKRLPRGIEKLMYLRYLSFRGCYLQELPSLFTNFPLLETLDLRVTVSCIMIIPNNVLRKLSGLRHLYFPLAFRSSDTNDKLKLDTLKKLEILENFDARVCDAGDLLLLENLQFFTGIVDGDNTDLKNIISTMSGVKFLRHSSIVIKRFDSYSEERRSIFGSLLECNGVHALEIEGFLDKFPHPERITGSNFTEMVFNGSEFSEDPMPILGKLPNLRKLALCDDAFLGKKMVCRGSRDNFPKLTNLKLAMLQYLEELEVEMGAMENLTILMVEKCDKLVTLPDALIEITSLDTIMIGSMPKEFQDRVKTNEKTRRLQIS